MGFETCLYYCIPEQSEKTRREEKFPKLAKAEKTTVIIIIGCNLIRYLRK